MYEDSIDQVKDKIINKAYLIFSIIAIPLLLASLLRIYLTGWKDIYFIHIYCIIPLLTVSFFRHRLDKQIKLIILLSIIFTLFISGMYNFGFLGNAKLFLIIGVVFTSVFWSLRAAFYMSGVYLLFYAFFTYLFQKNYITYSFDTNNYINSLLPWLTSGLSIVLITLGLMLIINQLFLAQAEFSTQMTKSELRYKFITESMSDVVCVIDTETFGFSYVSPSIAKLLGYKVQEVLALKPEEILAPEYRKFYSQRLSNRLAAFKTDNTQNLYTDELIYLCKDGKKVDVEVRSSFEIDESNDKVQLISTSRNITDRKSYERQLNSEKEFSDKLINSLPGIFFLYQKEADGYKFKRWNDNHELLLGRKKRELVNRNPLELLSPKYHHNLTQLLTKIENDGFASTELEFCPHENNIYTFYLEGHKFVDHEVTYLLGTGIDVTERKKYQGMLEDRTLQLEEQNKRLKEYAFYNSHELRAAFAKVKGLIQLRNIEESEDTKSEVDQLINQHLEELDEVIIKIQRIIE